MNDTQIKIGDYYKDCSYRPRICTNIDGDDIVGKSVIDGELGDCSLKHCCPEKITEKEALELKEIWITKGEKEVLIYHGYTREDVDEFFEKYRKE